MPRAHEESSIPDCRQGGVSARAGAADNQKGQPMVAAFEEQALDQLTKDARRALAQGVEPPRGIRVMRL